MFVKTYKPESLRSLFSRQNILKKFILVRLKSYLKLNINHKKDFLIL